MRTFYITVEGVVSRDVTLQASNVDEAMAEAKREFTAAVGATSAVVVTANEEKHA